MFLDFGKKINEGPLTIFLSHFISHATPGFGGNRVFDSKVASAIQSGKSSNSSVWTFNNHCGTHVDVPYHFSEKGRTLSQYTANDWIFSRTYLLEYKAANNELIEPGSWLEAVPLDVELLLIRTGFEEYRNEARYWQNNPGLSARVGRWLRCNRSSLRCVGFDFISLTSYSHREEGRSAHREFLCPDSGGAPILIIEDMSLKYCPFNLSRVIVAPLMVDEADGSPVTVIAW